MPFQPILPTFSGTLNGCNDTSPSGIADLRTGAPVFAGGLNLGDFFDLTEQEANQLSNTATGTLHAGRYRRIQVDSGATASNVKTGTIGYMVAGGQPQLNLVTSYDKSIVGAHPVIFLNVVTPGNYCFVQEVAGGVGNVLCGATLTKTTPNTADLLNATTLGVIDDPTVQELVPASIGIALDPPNPNTIIRAYLLCIPGLG
ncbi:MAG TPA: hypothetical protein VER98_03990 [Terriglobia bacterium]|nr:hypothetical protein [Terriglobia bacterium]